MEARKFAIGDQVRVCLDSYVNENPADVYTISRALPAMANVWQYRVKRVDDGQERAVSEQQLAKTPQASAQRFMGDMQQDAQRIRNARATERTRVVARRSEQERHRVSRGALTNHFLKNSSDQAFAERAFPPRAGTNREIKNIGPR